MKSITYNSSPLLASKTPVWRSKFIVAAIALAFTGLACRAAYVQVFNNDFFQRQGEVRFARTLELPANRGRIVDRNGLILASSVAAPSIWAIPEDIERDKQKLAQLAKLLEMPAAELNKRLEDEDKTFVWLKRQVDESVAQQITALSIKGVYQRKEYKRQYPEGEAAAHVLGFTNIEEITRAVAQIALGQEECLYLGNMDAKRDWGHAKDYVEAMWLILQQDVAEDFVIATGVTTKIRDFVSMAFAEVGIDLRLEGEGINEVAYVAACSNPEYQLPIGKKIVAIDEKYFRPTEVELLIGDPTKANTKLGWIPKYDLKILCAEMVEADLNIFKNPSKLNKAGRPIR